MKPDEMTAADIRVAERARVTDELIRMAEAAERTPVGITYEGGIRASDVARILRAAAREVASKNLAPQAMAVPMNVDDASAVAAALAPIDG